MSFSGRNPNLDSLRFVPLAADPATPQEGEIQYADGTARPEGFYQYKDGAWRPLGSDSAANLNYLKDSTSDAESSIGSWVTYADAAGTSPVDGTGGTANITLTRSTSTPLRGAASFLLSKDAVNRQGEGVSVDVTIDNADVNKPMLISFDLSASANFAFGNISSNSDIRVFVYDITNTVLIPVFPNWIEANGTFRGFFDSSSSLSYRLILHIGSTNATAYTLKFDNVYFGPNEQLLLSSDSDAADFPSNAAGDFITGDVTDPTFGTVTRNIAKYSKDGQFLVINWEFHQSSAGTNGSGIYYINIGSELGVEIDTDYHFFNSTLSEEKSIAICGQGIARIGAGFQDHVFYVFDKDRIAGRYSDATTDFGAAGFAFGNADLSYSVQIRVKIKGWTTGYETAASTLQNVSSSVTVTKNGSQSIANNTFTKVTFEELVADSLGEWDSTNNRINIKTPGKRVVSAALSWAPAGADTRRQISIYLNGTAIYETSDIPPIGGDQERVAICTPPMELSVGDYLEVFAYQNSGGSINVDDDIGTYFGMHKVESPSALVNIRKIAKLSDVKAAATDGGTFTSGSYATRDLNTEEDEFGIVSLSANQFTLQAGTYRIFAKAPAYKVNSHKAKLRNVTDSSDVILGTSEAAETSGNVQNSSIISGLLTLTAAKTFEIQHRCSNTQATSGYGLACNFGDSEVYTIVEIEKLT